MGKKSSTGSGGKQQQQQTAAVSSSSGGGGDGAAKLARVLDPHWSPEVYAGEPQELVPARPGFIVTCDGILAPHECSALVAAMDAGAASPVLRADLKPPCAADLKPKKNEALLIRDSLAVVDADFAALLWRRLRPLLPDVCPEGREGDETARRVPVGLVGDGRMGDATPNQFKLYRYTRGQLFGMHVDVSRKGEASGFETEYTMLVYLNSAGESARGAPDGTDGCQPLVGGDTVFMATAKTELCRCSPATGRVLLHAHGRRCLMHAAEEVTKGAKYVLRADVMYAPAAAVPQPFAAK